MLKKIFAVMIILFSLVAIPVQMPAMIAGFCYWNCAVDAGAYTDDETVWRILYSTCVEADC